MLIWGIVLGVLAIWSLVAVLLGVAIGRAVKVADTAAADELAQRRLRRQVIQANAAA